VALSLADYDELSLADYDEDGEKLLIIHHIINF